MKTRKSVIIVPHSERCVYRNTKKNPWSGVVKGTFWGNWRANTKVKTGRTVLWIEVLCNDPQCQGTKAVHTNILSEAP